MDTIQQSNGAELPRPRDIVKNEDGFYYIASTFLAQHGETRFLCIKYGTTFQVRVLRQDDISEVIRKKSLKDNLSALHISQKIRSCIYNYGGDMTYWLSPNGYAIRLGKFAYETTWLCLPYSLDEYYFTSNPNCRVRIIGKLRYDVSQLMSSTLERLTNGKVSWDWWQYSNQSTKQKILSLMNVDL